MVGGTFAFRDGRGPGPCRLWVGTVLKHKRGATMMKSMVVKRSVLLADHQTSVSLEDDFWNALKEIAGDRHLTLSELVSGIDKQRQHGNFSSALRLFVLKYYRDKAAERLNNEMLDKQSEPPPTVIS